MNARQAAGGVPAPPGTDPLTTAQVDYTEDEIQFMTAIEAYKRANQRPFPTLREVLRIALALGYRKVAPPEQMRAQP